MALVSSFFRLPRWRRRRARRNRMATQLIPVFVLLLLFLPLYLIYKPPAWVISALQRRYPRVLFHVRLPDARKVVALTIDDAPSQHTAAILDILGRANATATFFAIGGQIPDREADLRAILEGGHELGNHAMHDEPSVSVPSDRLRDEIARVDGWIDRAHAAVERPRRGHYFRPGSGVFSTRILDVAQAAGSRTILGGIYPHDPFVSYSRINAWHILSGLRPGAIIICHDRRSWTLPMLRRVVPEMRRRGYEVVTVSQLLEYAGTA